MKKIIIRLYIKIRFGRVTQLVASVDAGSVSEVAFYNKRNKVIGYWAYGYYDTSLPYRGQDVF